MTENSLISVLIDNLKDYLNSRINLIFLKSSEKIFRILSILISNTILILFAVFFLLFASTAIALLISGYYGLPYLGFLIVAIFYLLFFLLMYVMRKPWLENKITDTFIEQYFMEENTNE